MKKFLLIGDGLTGLVYEERRLLALLLRLLVLLYAVLLNFPFVY